VPSAPARPGRSARLTAAAALVLAEALLAFCYAGYLVVESIAAPTDAPAIGWGVAVFTVICGALIAIVARGLAAGRSWSRAPAVLVQLLLLLAVGLPLVQAGAYLVGVPTMVVAAAVLALVFTAPTPPRP
jgi:hypothetical protein